MQRITRHQGGPHNKPISSQRYTQLKTCKINQLLHSFSTKNALTHEHNMILEPSRTADETRAMCFQCPVLSIRWLSTVRYCRPSSMNQTSFYTRQTPQHNITQQAGARSRGRGDKRPVAFPDYHKKEAFPLVKCIRRYVWNGSLIILVMVRRKSIHSWRRYARKTIFTFSFPVTLTFTLELKFCPQLLLSSVFPLN